MLRRFWMSIPARPRSQIAIWFVVLVIAGFFLPDHWSTHGGMARATDASGRRWYVELEDKVTYYYGQPWSHTLSASWKLASSPPPAAGAISGPLTLTPDPPNATGRLYGEEGKRSRISDQLEYAAVEAARSLALTYSGYRIDWRGAAARVVYPLTAASVVMFIVALGSRRDRPKLIAAGICPECTHPLLPPATQPSNGDSPGGRQCPECGAVYR